MNILVQLENHLLLGRFGFDFLELHHKVMMLLESLAQGLLIL